jgi:hypothetical protein
MTDRPSPDGVTHNRSSLMSTTITHGIGSGLILFLTLDAARFPRGKARDVRRPSEAV